MSCWNRWMLKLGHKQGYEKNDAAGKEIGNRRNGHSAKTVRSEFGDVELAIPRGAKIESVFWTAIGTLNYKADVCFVVHSG